MGQNHIVNSIKSKKELNHMLFDGPAGCGKTTMAYVISKEFGLPIHELNASDNRKIDDVRGEIKRLSRIRGKRLILLDEADNLTQDAQQALRRIIEKTSSSIFILTGNNCWKLIDPIKSRCSIYTFKRLEDSVVLRRLLHICKNEGIAIDGESKEGFITLVKQTRGDLRKAIGMLEQIINKDNKITSREVLAFQKPTLAKEALNKAMSGDLQKAQELLEDSILESRMDYNYILKELFESIKEIPEDSIRARLFIKLSDAQNACGLGKDPLPILTAFIAYCWLVPHLTNECPVLNEQ